MQNYIQNSKWFRVADKNVQLTNWLNLCPCSVYLLVLSITQLIDFFTESASQKIDDKKECPFKFR